MNKTLTFVLGLLTGAAAGSTATYFLVKRIIEEKAAEEIEAYAEHCEERIQRIMDKMTDGEEEEVSGDDDEPDEDPEIKNNEGVKKYHHYSGPLSSDGDRSVFKDEKKEKEVTTDEVIKKWAEEDAENKIFEVTENEFLEADDEENDYHRETVDYFFYGDREVAYWGYNTDNQGTVEQKFGKPLKDLIGHAHQYLIDYTGEDGIGAAYFRNDDLQIIFEVIIHDTTGFNDRG